MHVRLQRKKLLIEARKCHYCQLIFRWPADDPQTAMRYYEKEYRSGKTTDLPDPEKLAQLRREEYQNSNYDFSAALGLVSQYLSLPARVLDFGASWGYVGDQFRRAGYEVECFELSRPRADYGRRQLQLTIHGSWPELLQSPLPRFDLVFASHVLEHLYDLWSTLERFASALKPGGLLFIDVPNGGGRHARRTGVASFIGEPHTIAFTSAWLRQNLPTHGFAIVDMFSAETEGKDFQCQGDGLVCVARRKPTAD